MPVASAPERLADDAANFQRKTLERGGENSGEEHPLTEERSRSFDRNHEPAGKGSK